MSGKISSFFKSMFSGSGADGDGTPGATLDYKGFTIQAMPRREGAGWLTAGVISQGEGEERKEHSFIRADTFQSRDEAEECALRKGKTIIDQQASRLF